VGHYSGQMRPSIIILTTFLLSCSTTDNRTGLFDDFADKKKVVIFLSNYDLDSVPKDIQALGTAKYLYIAMDSGNVWTIYPPLSALQQRAEIPPFRQLPDEITDLTNLQNLGLVGLNLKTLPDNFDKLQKLDSLILLMNKLTISEELEKLKRLKRLKYLVLFGNKVDTTDINELKRVNPKLVIDSGIE
jgi:Leucine-rich repeat (LRR) protein